MKIVSCFIEKVLFVLEIFKCLYFSLPFSWSSPLGHSSVGWSKINLKIYDIIDCLNKILTHFVWCFEEKKYDIETLPIYRILNKEDLYIRMLVTEPFLILVNNPKQLLHARNSSKNKTLWKRLSKSYEKVNFIFLLNPAAFNGQDYKK